MSHLSERKIIEAIARQSESRQPDLVKGIGDDCAVVRKAGGLVELWTTDALVQGVHFDLGWHPPFLLGRKAASVNLSDIGAMGGRPRFALLALGLPDGCGQPFLDQLTAGFLEVLREYDTVLAGGDTVSSRERLLLSITMCGEMKEQDVCYRSAARPGDLVWVSGRLGEAAGGLALCRQGRQDEERYRPLVQAHLDPRPRLQLGQKLAQSGLIHAMMDISDGLATDLAHLCQASGVGAELMGASLPLTVELQGAAADLELDALELGLQGGEDYQLVFTAPAEHSTALQKLKATEGLDIAPIGRITKGDRVMLCRDGERLDISFRGYEHTF